LLVVTPQEYANAEFAVRLGEMSQSQGIRVGPVFGIPIYVDFSWVLIFGAFCFLLQQQFAANHKDWSSAASWAVGISTSVLFFTSVVLHELAHSVVSQAYKIKVLSITLFIFGGLARISREPSKAMQEFNIALAGPVASGMLACTFYGLSLLFTESNLVTAPLSYLAWANGLLALFNLLPGFPLDGGRIFRAMVWGATNDFSKATRIAGASGKLIAYLLIAYGLGSLFTKNYDNIWFVLIGLYLLNAAQTSVAQVTIRESLAGLRAADVMSQEVPTIPANMSLEEYSNEALRTGRRVHIVTMGDRLSGLMNVAALNQVPREEWNMNSVQAVMVPRDKIIWASPEEPLLRLLERLMAADVNQMPVVSHGEDGSAHIVGIVSREAILRVIQTRSELGHGR
jgi:Zn-dependent protease/predicted transcriptional regulator